MAASLLRNAGGGAEHGGKPEVQISGRRFIAADRDAYADGNICLGLIEVTG